jgi:hypothetical protein
MTQAKRPRPRAWFLLVPAVIVVGLIVASSFFERPAPPGEQIVNQVLPDKHPTGPCYGCHKGMATAEQLQGRPVPSPHPSEHCDQCHEGLAGDAREPSASPAGDHGG